MKREAIHLKERKEEYVGKERADRYNYNVQNKKATLTKYYKLFIVH